MHIQGGTEVSVVGQIECHKVTEPGHSLLASADTAALAKSTLDIIKQHEEY